MAATNDAAKRHTKDTKTELVRVRKPKKRYKYCIVPECKNTIISSPEKLFFSIPTGEVRLAWCEAMGRRPPAYMTLSPMCNRFCCEDHFDLEKDMANYMQWKLMGTKGITKLLLKKGVLPHKFDCQSEKIKTTKTHQVEQKSHRDFLKDILEQARNKQMEETLSQRLAKKHRVNILKRQITKKVKAKQNLKLPSEKEDILEQRIDKISHATQPIMEIQEQDIETYTFKIETETEDNYETNDGDSVLGVLFPQGIDIAGEDNSHLLGINVKFEELNEEFKPELAEIKQENNAEGEADFTIATEINPVLMENSAPCINVTNNLTEPTADKGDDFEPVVKKETQGMIEKTANSLSRKTNCFVTSENIRDNEVYERVIIGQQTQEVVGDDIKITLM